MARKIIVIGSGAAGMTAASSARETDKDAEIIVFTEEEYIAYSPCAIPFVLEGKIKDFQSIIMHDVQFYKQERNIDIRIKTKVITVDSEAKTVTLNDGTVQPYDSLIIASGGNVFVPPINGADLPGVFKVRFVKDGMAIQEAMKSCRKVVVAGGGVIGLEMAVALKRAGLEVIVAEMFPQVIPRICDADIALKVQAELEKEGVCFLMGKPLGAIVGTDKVEKVVIGDVEYECDMVIMATGVRANLELPNQLGLEIGPLGAVRVSPTLQPYRRGRLVKDIYLAGDVIMCNHAAVPGPTMSQLGSTAVREGRVAGINAAGGYTTFPEILSAWISQVGDLQVAGTGLSKGLADYYGISVVEGRAVGLSRARYYPGGTEVIVKLLAEKETHRLVGAQILGREEVNGKINWLTAAIMKGVTAEEFVNAFENAYCPPTSMVKDVVCVAAENLMRNL